MKKFIRTHRTKILISLTGILALWLIVIKTSLNGFISLTGIYNASVPKEAALPEIDPDKGYYLEEIKDGVYFITSYSHNTIFMVSDESVVVLDALPSLGDKYLQAIREVTDKPISHMIYSHSHSDHIESAHLFGNDIEIIAHELTAQKLKEANDPKRPVPTATFETDTTLVIGGKTIELAYFGIAHSPGNIAIYLPEEKILTMIDIVFPKWIPIHEFAIAEDIAVYYEAYDIILDYDFEYYVGGHAVIGTYEDVQEQKEYIHDIKEAASEVFATVDAVQLGKRAYNSPNTFVTVNFGMNKMACKCEDKVLEKWEGKLAYADVYTRSHCLRMIFDELTE